MLKRRTGIVLLLSVSLVMGSWTGVFAADSSGGQAAAAGHAQAKAMLQGREYASDQLVVTFDGDMSGSSIRKEIKKQDAAVKDMTGVYDGERAAVVRIDSDDSMTEAIEKIQDSPKVTSVQPNYRYRVTADDPLIGTSNGQAYQLSAVNAKKAWEELGSTHGKTKVAVIDTGCDTKHEDLQKNLDKSDSVKTDAGTAVPLTEDADAEDGHGTHVTGIIGATYGNGLGIAGIASGTANDLADVMTIGASYDGESLYSFDCIDAINIARAKGAKVINMSWGGYGRDLALENCIRDAYSSGIVMVAAAGNDGTDMQDCPGDMGEVISVCATNSSSRRTYWSDYGVAKDISAPGNEILSTTPADDYQKLSGTSMASPAVAAAAALVLDANENLTPAQVKNILCATALDIEDTGFDIYAGYGLVQADAAVRAAKAAGSGQNVTGLAVKENTLALNMGETHMLETLIQPAAALNKVTWSSDRPDIAAVDEYGNVTGITAGSAKVTGTVAGYAGSVVCSVTVNQSAEATGITVTQKAATASVGDLVEVAARVTPAAAYGSGDIQWSSSNNKVAAIDSSGGTIECRSCGKATIRAMTIDGRYSDSFEITVGPQVSKVMLVSSVPWIQMGDTARFTASAYPSAAAADITWRSSNRYIARVDQNGRVTPVKSGRVYIIAKADNGQNAYRRISIIKKNYRGKDYRLRIAKKTGKKVTLKWSAIPAASGYAVYRKASAHGKYKKLCTVKKTVYTNRKLKASKEYRYKVRAKYVKNGKTLKFGYSRAVERPAY